jgi:hypothetical protein
MATTVTNTNPITITGGTMAAGARATIYPGQIKRSFKVTAIGILAGTTASTLVIGDNSTAANVLFKAGPVAAAGLNYYEFAQPKTWADWIVSTLGNATDTVLVWIK